MKETFQPHDYIIVHTTNEPLNPYVVVLLILFSCNVTEMLRITMASWDKCEDERGDLGHGPAIYPVVGPEPANVTRSKVPSPRSSEDGAHVRVVRNMQMTPRP